MRRIVPIGIELSGAGFLSDSAATPNAVFCSPGTRVTTMRPYIGAIRPSDHLNQPIRRLHWICNGRELRRRFYVSRLSRPRTKERNPCAVFSSG